jgi:hypothetical protein
MRQTLADVVHRDDRGSANMRRGMLLSPAISSGALYTLAFSMPAWLRRTGAGLTVRLCVDFLAMRILTPPRKCAP